MLAQISRATSNIMQALIPSGRMSQSSASMPSTAPWADYWYSSMGLPNSAGVVGGDEAYEFVSTCLAATRFLCGVGSTIPINLTLRKKQTSGRYLSSVVEDDPRQSLINDEANSEQHAMSARSMAVAWQINKGTGFAEIQRDERTKEPLAWWPIYPTRCKPFRSDSDGSLWWHVRNSNGSESDIPERDMLRVPYTLLSTNGLTGIGVSDRAFQTIQLGQSLDRTENDASMSGVPRIVVESPRPMNQPEQDAFRRQWKELYQQGGEGVALLVGGMKASKLSWSATESDFDNRRARHQLTCASLYDVPPLLLQLILDPHADAGKLLQMFQKCGLKWLNMWVQELNRKFLTKEERLKGYCWKIDYKSLLEADHAGRAAYYSSLFPLGTFSSNDILIAEDMNPYPDGDKRYVQGAMRPVDEPYNANAPQNPPMDPKQGKADPLKSPKPGKAKQAALKAGARTMLEDCLRRLTSKEAKAAVKASAKPGEWLAWVESFYADHEPWVVSELKLPLEVCAVFGFATDAKAMAAQIVDKSKSLLISAADGPRDGFSQRVESLAAEWERDRASSTVRAITELN